MIVFPDHLSPKMATEEPEKKPKVPAFHRRENNSLFRTREPPPVDFPNKSALRMNRFNTNPIKKTKSNSSGGRSVGRAVGQPSTQLSASLIDRLTAGRRVHHSPPLFRTQRNLTAVFPQDFAPDLNRFNTNGVKKTKIEMRATNGTSKRRRYGKNSSRGA
jgi:hypothetical protein